MSNAPPRVRATQLVVAELVVIGLLAASRGPWWLLTGLVVFAAGVLLATFGQVDGRYWYQAAFSYGRFARRRRRAANALVAAAIGGDPAPSGLAWLRTLAPDLRIRPSTVVSGSSTAAVGVASDDHGWFAVIEVSPTGPSATSRAVSPAPRNPGPARPDLPLAELAALVGPGSGRPGLSSAQAVLRPDGRLGWLAVRLSAVDAVALERARGPAEVPAVVGRGADRAARVLSAAGYPAVALDPAGLLAALVAATGLDGPPQEHWAYWRSGARLHAVFQARDWPARLPLAGAGLGVSISVTGTGTWGVLIRVSARPGQLGPHCRRLTRAAALAGVRLHRLDGEHAPAAYACSPTGRPAGVVLRPDRAGPVSGPVRRLTRLGVIPFGRAGVRAGARPAAGAGPSAGIAGRAE